ncbi:TatD family hydrolase [Pedosphaera parvula]|uniref:TatD-related deoxyribonuclease n=1 Tax=Pedosphaera parvula (strain Ellin514) TaxID=320771 RepID=B9XDN2_PEDPL|nr:TatD family hydrolase [Pedosphaera parvula]EEF62178.1 TatD-related deoxyribonuclease [Pedosphaera parvula Ellin514]
MSAALYDAHNHLQATELSPHLGTIQRQLNELNVAKMVVNGTQEQDWPAVLELARNNRMVIPTFGLHPWYVSQRSVHWQEKLTTCLNQVPAGIGEIGLDRWIEDYDLPQQEEVFVWQLRLAAERNLPVSIHCLRAWGRLLELLQEQPRPQCGFLLHSYGGPQEMIQPLAKLGAYFSISGHFAQERKGRQQEVFRQVPRDRLLIETDAPDMLPPEKYTDFPITGESSGKAVNNPANIGAIYRFVAELVDEQADVLRQRTEENFRKLFGRLLD